jgi:hypothetical protein
MDASDTYQLGLELKHFSLEVISNIYEKPEMNSNEKTSAARDAA